MKRHPYEKICAIVLAGGKGNRLGSFIPKVLNPLAGKAMILYTLDTLRELHLPQIIVVVGFKADIVKAVLGDYYTYAYQEPEKPRGTGDALKAGLTKVEDKFTHAFVLYGDDSAFYKAETFKRFIEFHLQNNNVLSFINAELENPFGLGRLIRDPSGNLIKIVEEHEATEEERKTKEVNLGVYLFKKSWMQEAVKELKISPKGEYYITDLLSIALEQKQKVGDFKLKDTEQWWGVNTTQQLEEANRRMILDLKARKKRDVTFIIDVDNTILNTGRLKQALIHTILDVLDVTDPLVQLELKNIFWSVYEEIRREKGFVDIPATAERFCQQINRKDFAKVISYFMLLVPNPSFLYPLVYQTIQRLRTYGRVVIYTDGDLIYQPIKVERIGIPHVLNRKNIYIFEYKVPFAKDMLDIHSSSEKIFVIDDKISIIETFRNLNPKIKGVLVKQGEYAEKLTEEQIKAADFVTHNFTEVLGFSEFFKGKNENKI